MRTTLEINGFPEFILEKIINIGLASSKTEAIKLGLLALNDKYKIVKDYELELVAKKLKKEQKEMKKKGLTYIDEDKALEKYL